MRSGQEHLTQAAAESQDKFEIPMKAAPADLNCCLQFANFIFDSSARCRTPSIVWKGSMSLLLFLLSFSFNKKPEIRTARETQMSSSDSTYLPSDLSADASAQPNTPPNHAHDNRMKKRFKATSRRQFLGQAGGATAAVLA